MFHDKLAAKWAIVRNTTVGVVKGADVGFFAPLHPHLNTDPAP
ncbi:hypothetical protein ANO14919_041190 [Xylariales sp. No.14919]|nr:hypothetical protein ANO14919_041190 [Xylariales sp. No.14919]